MGEAKTEMSPGKADQYRKLSEEAKNYNLGNDLVSEMAMQHLSAVAKSINRAHRKAAVKKR